MAFAPPATPQRPLPGMYMMTPAVNQSQQATNGSRPPLFRAPTSSQQPNMSTQQSQTLQQPAQSQQTTVQSLPSSSQTLTPIERAARTINDTLAQEKRYPELEGYVTQGVSAEYDVTQSPAWAPFQKVKSYEIPDRILEHVNQSQLTTRMGLFAEINHAWIAIDSGLYLWDYTHPNPELAGWEEQPNAIDGVELMIPRPGVFVPQITHVLVVSTAAEIYLIGVQCQRGPEGVHGITMYKSGMQVSIRGVHPVTNIAGSRKTGRIFFSGTASDDVYELTYQQQDKWFTGKCGKINHTSKSYSSLVPALPFVGPTKSQQHIKQMVIDDSRNLLYTLSSTSTIRVFHFKGGNELNLAVELYLVRMRTMMSHMQGAEMAIKQDVQIASICPIPATQSSRLSLLAVTTNGCRLYMSATSSQYYSSAADSAPTNMQILHVRLPPRDTTTSAPQASSQSVGLPRDYASDLLKPTWQAYRFSPGYFFCFVRREKDDLLFLSAPDTGRIYRPDPTQPIKFPETAIQLQLGGLVQAVGAITAPFAASSSPGGFGNELAVQFDQEASQIAVFTNGGVQTIRRRRLVDIYAAAIRYGGSEEGLETQIKRFIRLYGRAEATATALAVACGQGSDVTPDSRVAKVNDQEVLEWARKAFIEYGGKPSYNENSIVDSSTSPVDSVRPSPRHDAIALYISRLIRSIWKAPIALIAMDPRTGMQVTPSVPVAKLNAIQKDLNNLQEFISANKSFIEGLSGPEALRTAATPQDETALAGENRALTALVALLGNIIEGISFVLVLFDEKVDEILLSLPEQTRNRVKELTFEGLFAVSSGRELTKDLVKAIVNQNIAKGSNVESVAESLRRRCGSFCSADDVVIFKAQEQLKRASEAGAQSEGGRSMLNQSLRNFSNVAASLTMEQLMPIVEDYVNMSFYAGAIVLCLKVAQQKDPANRALGFVKDGAPEQDSRRAAYDSRKKCYDLIFAVIDSVDRVASAAPEMVDGHYTVSAKRKNEAYQEINDSEDEVFQTSLYDWYLQQGWSDRLLDITSPFVVTYLKRKSQEDAKHADLLWRYYAHYNLFLDAAQVQLHLAKSGFDLTLDQRIEYLSRAKTNASARVPGLSSIASSRQSRQDLIREVSDLLDLANIQEDLIQRLKDDERLTGDREAQVLQKLAGQILPLDDLYNQYADQAGYYDICLLIYHIADYRNISDIRATWQNLVEMLHAKQVKANQESAKSKSSSARAQAQPYEVVAERIRELGARMSLNETIFNIPTLVFIIEKYSLNWRNPTIPASPTIWMDIFLDISVPHESLLAVLENIFMTAEKPFDTQRTRRYIAQDLVYVCRRWFDESGRSAGQIFGGEENARNVLEVLQIVIEEGGLGEQERSEAETMRSRTMMLMGT